MSTISTLVKPEVRFRVPANRPFSMAMALIFSDLLALILAVASALSIKVLINHQIDLHSYLRLWPFLLVFPAAFSLEGLYSGVALSAPVELRRIALSLTAIFALLAAVTVSLRGAQTSFTWLLCLTVILSITLIPIFRAVLRRRFADQDWWGYPAVLFGSGEHVRRVIRIMQSEPWLGLKPIAVVGDFGADSLCDGVPVVDSSILTEFIYRDFQFVYGVQVLSKHETEQEKRSFERLSGRFAHQIVMPDLFEFSSLWVNPKNFGGMLGLETHQQVMARPKRIAKRLIDLSLATICAIFALPLVAIICAWIRLDSPGPVFYGHPRLGRGGKQFPAWKFRSMVMNGDEILERCLASDPARRAEWHETQKLRDDPRVTRAGKFLRSTSLDELPQLWNVLRGEMSLVGPRPIAKAEVVRYGDYFEVYSKVTGGVTGLWQVSGRSQTTYAERVALDTYYVRNWSVWLDLCILFQTIGVVLARRGAY